VYAGIYTSPTWNYPSMGTRTSTSAAITGATTFGDIQLGNCTAPTFTTTFANVTCFGDNNGSITITASGGTTPYEYSLNNGALWLSMPTATYTINNLAPATYKIMLRDNTGCASPACP
jgi:hypothetical protein